MVGQRPETHGPRAIKIDDPVIFEQAVSMDGLAAGWAKVWENKGAAGGDGISVDMFARDAHGWIGRLRRSLLSGEYRPGPLRSVDIPKDDGRSLRRLDIPCIADRVVQSSVAQALSPLLDEEFEPSSFAYRPGRSVKQAVAQVSAAQRAGFEWIVDADIEDYFGSVPHDTLLERFAQSVSEGPLTGLVTLWLTHAAPGGRGLAQGSPLSPLLANLYLDRVDEAFHGRGSRFIRFADDFVVMTKTQAGADAALAKVEALLKEHALVLNADKTRVLDFARGLEFLGHLFVRSLVMKRVDEGGGNEALAWMRRISREDTGRLQDEMAREAEEERHSKAGHAPGFRVLYLYQPDRRLAIRNQAFTVEERRALAGDEEPGAWRELIAVHSNRIDRIEIGPKATLTPAARDLALASDTMIAYVNGHGETLGWTGAQMAPRARRHLAQAGLSLDEQARIDLAGRLVEGRIRNQRAVLRRLARRDKSRPVLDALVTFNRILGRGDKTILRHASSVAQLTGREGEATAGWWRALSRLMPAQMRFEKRTRRNETADGANAMFNFLGWLVLRDITVAVQRAGLHPGFGVLHVADDRRDACCYDLMEEFRAPLIGGLGVYCANRRFVSEKDFTLRPDGGVRMSREAAEALIRAYESRVARAVKSPRSGKKMVWRQLMVEQAFALAAHVEGGQTYQPYVMDY
ncbi:MAG: CRISPR-associated endonuclease Cas1 [Rhizobiaceae bacterium]|nr:CRISPR-associated endonuclease Cas1 [Rhizobiaceae bacterium]